MVEFSRDLLGLRSALRRARGIGGQIQSVGFAIQSEVEEAERLWANYAEAAGGDSQERLDKAFADGRERIYYLREAILALSEVQDALEAELQGPAGAAMGQIIGDWQPPENPAPPPPPPPSAADPETERARG